MRSFLKEKLSAYVSLLQEHATRIVIAFFYTTMKTSTIHFLLISLSLRSAYAFTTSLSDTFVGSFEKAFDGCKDDVSKTCKVTLGPSKITGRLGLIATSKIKKGDVALSMPYDDMFGLTPSLARNVVYKDIIPEAYDGWTGDNGLIALLILNEVARADNSGVSAPKRKEPLQHMMETWVRSLPSPEECETLHPILWNADDHEVLQSSSTNKIYQILDDIEEDAAWLTENIWDKNREAFPEEVVWNDHNVPCFTEEGYKWAMALATSRSVFTDASLRIIPFLDFANHDDKGREIEGGRMGAFGTTRGALLYMSKDCEAGEEVLCSYGPKSAADYVLEHGFCPVKATKTAVAELTFEMDSEDNCYDDKLDILEFETYEQAPMDPVQSFDLVSEPGEDGNPDPALMQFARMMKLGGADSFLLESIFRKDVWGFMSMPVSETNELQAMNVITDKCQETLDEFADRPTGGPEMCDQVCEAERKALTKVLEFLNLEKEALDLKEYYQERRLKDLGLNSDWSKEEDFGADPDAGSARLSAGGDFDW